MDAQAPVPPTRSLTLDLPPSCMQFCPLHPAYFVVGTYNLQKDDNAGDQVRHGDSEDDNGATAKKPQSRDGSLVVFRVDGDELTRVQTASQPSALLDLRFHPGPDERQGILAAVSSTGALAIFKLDPTHNAAAPLQHLATSRCEDLAEDILLLQCNWHPVLGNAIAVTASNGLARLLHLDDEWMIRETTDLDIPNSLEAWSIALSPPAAGLDGDGQAISVYSGGDDSLLRYTTLLCGNTGAPEMPFAPMTVKGQHDAGVTAILPLPLHAADGGRVVVTGSYDDHLRVFAIHDLHESRGIKRLRLATDKNLGGGVWRLNLVDILSLGDGPSRVRILASCMHAGARLVEISTEDGSQWECRILARFEEHKSMNYASDFVVARGGKGLRCVSTSFYDRLLCLWEA
ncbi:Protein MSN5 [Tolypocladium capitatum]|uniref:Protein MSN5 n=1 Tax=Tolypocladium capitatum TaxID=45235 RepID=A0A2K3QD33_9HYPO|nr:Protein MSN5 [Tolypocladium capitatum]